MSCCSVVLFMLECFMMLAMGQQDTPPPVVYVTFGEMPPYLHLNVELAARRNPVVVISDVLPSSYNASSPHNVRVERMEPHMGSAKGFAPHYVHMSRDTSAGRQRHELRCFQRWFVLLDYMRSAKLDKVFFGDGDSSVFGSVQQAWQDRAHCDAAINIETQGGNWHWVGAGEASLWSLRAIEDFCDFTQRVYTQHVDTLRIKGIRQPSVVDMSLLWLWWTAHWKKEDVGWKTGRPYHNEWEKTKGIQHFQQTSDAAFLYAKTLSLPVPKYSDLRLCNGLDVVNRTVFDHMHAWSSGSSFSLDVSHENGKGEPFCMGASMINGGRPEVVEDSDKIKALEQLPLKVINIHYQGDSKKKLPYDVCRVLLRTGNRHIEDRSVALLCSKELDNKKDPLPCIDHIMADDKTIRCF